MSAHLFKHDKLSNCCWYFLDRLPLHSEKFIEGKCYKGRRAVGRQYDDNGGKAVKNTAPHSKPIGKSIADSSQKRADLKDSYLSIKSAL